MKERERERERETESLLGVRTYAGERLAGTTTEERVVAGPGESVRGEKCTKRRTQRYAFTCHMLTCHRLKMCNVGSKNPVTVFRLLWI